MDRVQALESPMPGFRRRIGFSLSLTLGILCLAAGALLATLSRSFFNSSSFAESTAACLADEGVAAFVADRITGAILQRNHDLVAVRPLILATAKAVVASEPFRGLVRTAAYRAHQGVLSDTSRQLVLSLPDVEVLLRAAIGHASPQLAARIPERVNTLLASFENDPRMEFVMSQWRMGARMRWAALALLATGWGLLAVAFWFAPSRNRALVRIGFALILCGLAVAAVRPAGSLIVGAAVDAPLLSGAVDGLWRTYMSGLRIWGVFFAGLGILIAAGGASLLEALNPVAEIRRARDLLVTVPRARTGRIVWGSLLTVAGLLLVAFPVWVLTACVVVIGICAVYAGTRELFRLALETVSASPDAQLGIGSWRLARRAALVIAACTILVAGWVFVQHPSVTPMQPSLSACNGHAELCGRRVDQVVFAGAHNAMSHEQTPDWMFPHHQAGIPQQLRDGVRALLFDVHYGFPGASRVKTDLTGRSSATLERAVGAEGVAAAQRIRDRLTGVSEDRREIYLCHGFCELGAYELKPVLGQIRSFLIENPGEVLILIIEDYVSPQDLAGTFEQAGLKELVFLGSSSPWPAMGELVSSGQRVIAFIESGRPDVPWLRAAFEHFQETPYTFHKPEEFSCRPNRGGTSGSLLLVNHWIETTPAPRPSNAEAVNSHNFLLKRAQRCSEERGKVVNVLAVDFYRSGDLLKVADTLNGLNTPD